MRPLYDTGMFRARGVSIAYQNTDRSTDLLIGVVSDTHGYVDPRLLEAFRNVDAIIHAGDVGGPAVVDELARLAPLYAVRGNNDRDAFGSTLPERLDVRLAGLPIHVVHELPQACPGPDTGAVIFGHSHRQVAEWRSGVFHLNPGAAGRAGFHRLQTAALLDIGEGVPSVVSLIELGPRLPLEGGPRRRSAAGSGKSPSSRP